MLEYCYGNYKQYHIAEAFDAVWLYGSVLSAGSLGPADFVVRYINAFIWGFFGIAGI